MKNYHLKKWRGLNNSAFLARKKEDESCAGCEVVRNYCLGKLNENIPVEWSENRIFV